MVRFSHRLMPLDKRNVLNVCKSVKEKKFRRTQDSVNINLNAVSTLVLKEAMSILSQDFLWQSLPWPSGYDHLVTDVGEAVGRLQAQQI